MKISEQSKEKKEKTKKRETIKPKKELVLIVAQEFKFARLLSGNEKKTRDRVLKTLKKWLLNCFEKGYEFKEDDFIRVWKGLFYAVWMSDKPLIQEELCENISAVLDLFPAEHLRHALLMYKAGLRVLAAEWYGLDQHRTDKFLMLVRRYLRASLRCLLRSEWSQQSCQMYAKTLSASDGILSLKTPHYARNATSMLLHFIDCYLEEIAKVSNGAIPDASLVELLRPMCSYLCGGEAPVLCSAARRLLTALVRQSDQGLQYQLATAAWQKMGCPEGGPEALELISDDEDGDVDDSQKQDGETTDDEEESSEKPLDPRAGRVNVELPCLPVPATLLANMLRDMLASATSTRHKRLRICLQRFEQLSRDEYPLRVQTYSAEAGAAPRVKPKTSAQALRVLEKKLVAASDELALRGLSRKHRKRLLAKSRSGTSIVEEVETMRLNVSTEATNSGWQVETAEPEVKKHKRSTSNKENKKRKNERKDARDGKMRKVDPQVNGHATHKRLKVDKQNKPTKESQAIGNKLDHITKLNKNNVVENGERIRHKGKEQSKEKVIKANKNGIQKDKVKNNVTTLGKSKVNDNKSNDKVLLNGKHKKSESPSSPKVDYKNPKTEKNTKIAKNPTLVVNKVKQFQKQTKKLSKSETESFDTPKKVKFMLKNNSMQQPVDYYKSVRQSPSIPFDGTKQPNKTNLKPSTPSPINPFFKKKLRAKH